MNQAQRQVSLLRLVPQVKFLNSVFGLKSYELKTQGIWPP